MDAVALPDAHTALTQGMAILMGLALASTCGLRAFLPLFTLSCLARLGYVDLGTSFAWMGSTLSLVCFGVAVVAETLGDKIPAVDHALDAAGVVVKPLAATLTAASVVTHWDPMLAVVLGLMTGGVAAEGVHLTKAKARLVSSAVTGTLGNPILSILEDLLSLGGVILAVVLPGLVVFTAASTVVLFWLWRRRRQRRRAAAVAAS